MSRPRKMRTVCCIPQDHSFGPKFVANEPENTITMSIDEYESIRLIDLVGLTQEQCAIQMNVARTTVQSIYSEARKKIADAIINRKWLVVTGGDIVICDGKRTRCDQRGCQRHIRHCAANSEANQANDVIATEEQS